MLSEGMANHAALRQYLLEISEDNSTWKNSFRQMFYRAMRDVLTSRQYDVLMLYYVQGLRQNQIAARWGVSPSAVSKHLKRARKRLTVMLAYNLEFQTRKLHD